MGRLPVGVTDRSFGEASPPDGSFTSVSAGGSRTCGVRPNGSVACWGNQASPPDDSFISISAGLSLTCGVRIDRSVVCWGDDELWPSLTARWLLHLRQRRVSPRLWYRDRRIGCLLGLWDGFRRSLTARWLLHLRERRV